MDIVSTELHVRLARRLKLSLTGERITGKWGASILVASNYRPCCQSFLRPQLFFIAQCLTGYGSLGSRTLQGCCAAFHMSAQPYNECFSFLLRLSLSNGSSLLSNCCCCGCYHSYSVLSPVCKHET